MHQSIHQQLIRGIQGLNPAQARELQGLLARLKDGVVETGDTAGIGSAAGTGDATGTTASLTAGTLATDAQAGDPAMAASTEAVPHDADGDLPQPVCAQEDQPVAPTGFWGPPPLSSINFEQMQLIACLIREANEARNARRQRYGM